MTAELTKVCGVSGKTLEDDDIIVIEHVTEEGDSEGYPRVVLEEYHDDRFEIINKLTYGELKEKSGASTKKGKV